MEQDFVSLFVGLFALACIVLGVIMIVALWKIFQKAGQPGWASIVPFYNMVVLLRIAGKPGWWLLLFLVPFVNLVISFITYIAVAKGFGKGPGFGVGLVLLGFVFFPILGFGDARYDRARLAIS